MGEWGVGTDAVSARDSKLAGIRAAEPQSRVVRTPCKPGLPEHAQNRAEPLRTSFEYNPLFDPEVPEAQRPNVIGRARFGRIVNANSDASGGLSYSELCNQIRRTALSGNCWTVDENGFYSCKTYMKAAKS